MCTHVKLAIALQLANLSPDLSSHPYSLFYCAEPDGFTQMRIMVVIEHGAPLGRVTVCNDDESRSSKDLLSITVVMDEISEGNSRK
jgi:hypothetical protein